MCIIFCTVKEKNTWNLILVQNKSVLVRSYSATWDHPLLARKYIWEMMDIETKAWCKWSWQAMWKTQNKQTKQNQNTHGQCERDFKEKEWPK